MDRQYAGFWIRTVAKIADTLLVILIMILGTVIYLAIAGAGGLEAIGLEAGGLEAIDLEAGGLEAILNTGNDYLSSRILERIIFFILVIWFWIRFRATPGKMLFGIEIVDAGTGQNISIRQAIIRYLGYIPAILIFGLGILWIAIDKRKQGWHDKLAGTVVLRKTEQERDFTL